MRLILMGEKAIHNNLWWPYDNKSCTFFTYTQQLLPENNSESNFEVWISYRKYGNTFSCSINMVYGLMVGFS